MSNLWRLVGLLAPHRARFVVGTVALLLGSGLSLIYPQAARYAIDLGMGNGSGEWLNTVAVGMLLIFVAHAALVWIRHYIMSWLGERAVTDLRRLVFDTLLRLPSAWFHERRTGELVGRLAADVTVIEGVVGSELSMALRNVVQLIGGLVLLFVVNTYLTLMMLLIVPPIVLGSMAFGRMIRRMSKLVQDRLAHASGQVQESISGIQTVQAFVREDHESKLYEKNIEAAFAQSIGLIRWRASFMASVSTAGYLAIAGIVWLGGREVIAGHITAGDLAAFMLYTFMVAVAIGSVANIWGSLQRAAGATQRLFAIIDTVPEIADPKLPLALPRGAGAVHFSNVSFHYASRPDQDVLRGIELAIAGGEVVALVGPSGGGKSTLASLLLRFYDPVEGAVLVEGVDIRTLALAELRRAMAIVSQEPVLFSGTVRDNIAYARPQASDEEIASAARDANAHEFIERFGDGYQTLVGERGIKLSGGQKQRIAIARAILANPRILILDEATSNLDAESEALVQEALAHLMRGRTTLVIAHRLSTVRDAHRIVVLNQGRIVEQGTHDQLISARGAYHSLVEHQMVAADASPEPQAVNRGLSGA